MTNRSRVNDPPILAQKQQKMAIFDKTDFWGLKYPLEVRVQHETCSTICGTPVPAILNHKPGNVNILFIVISANKCEHFKQSLTLSTLLHLARWYLLFQFLFRVCFALVQNPLNENFPNLAALMAAKGRTVCLWCRSSPVPRNFDLKLFGPAHINTTSHGF